VILGQVVMDRIRKQPGRAYAFLPQELRPRGNFQAVMADAWEARSLSYWRRVFARLRAANGDLMATYRGIKAEGDAETAAEHKVKATYELNAILMPVFSEVIQKVQQDETQRRLREGMLALFFYRMRNGRFPASLSALSSPSLIDPFNDQPLHYRRIANGFILYSVGPDLIDNGGMATPARNGGQPPDIVVSYP